MTFHKKALLALCVSSLMATAAHAAEEEVVVQDDSISRNVFAMYRVIDADSSRTSDGGPGVHVGFGFPLNKERLGLEVGLFTHTYEQGQQNGSDYYGRGVVGDLVYSFGNRREFTPFILGGGGLVYNDVACGTANQTTANAQPERAQFCNKLRNGNLAADQRSAAKDSDEFGGFLNIGAGFVAPVIADWVKVRAEVRHVIDFFNGGTNDNLLGVGVEIDYGRSKLVEKRVERIVEKPVERIVEIEKPVERIVEVEKQVDRLVDQPDTDRDNIPDDKDMCPNTPLGARTDNSGCVLKNQVIRLDKIFFDFDKTTLRKESTPAIEGAVRMLKEQPDLNVEIAGHTDNFGTETYNDKLSSGRASAVMQAILGYGIKPSRLRSRGYGERFPLKSNDTEEGRQFNRRVEMRIE